MLGGHTLPGLPYAYSALEPYISEEIMRLHHTKHHQAYINALNDAEILYAKAKSAKGKIACQQALKFNGGGHINHSLFWKNLAPTADNGGNGGILQDGALKQAIIRSFGSLDSLIKEFNVTIASIEGSGWGWIGVEPISKRLEIVTTRNQDPLLTHYPVIGIDIWEHAFYLQYFNAKLDYLVAIWNVIDFDEAERRYLDAVNNSADAAFKMLNAV